MKLLNTAFIFLSGIFVLTAHASSNGGRGGGDIKLIRRGEIETFITDKFRLKVELAHVFRNLKLEEIQNPEVRNEISVMVNGGVLDDIEKSPYSPLDHCYDDQPDGSHKEHSASTRNGARNDDVCFNMTMLTDQAEKSGVMTSELVGLAAHEEARHFGFDDTIPGEMHPIAQFIAEKARIQDIESDDAFRRSACKAKLDECEADSVNVAQSCFQKTSNAYLQINVCLKNQADRGDECGKDYVVCSKPEGLISQPDLVPTVQSAPAPQPAQEAHTYHCSLQLNQSCPPHIPTAWPQTSDILAFSTDEAV